MTEHAYAADWRAIVEYSAPGPKPAILHDAPELRVLVAGLEPGGRIPPHPGPQAVYHALDGEGILHLDGTPLPFAAGAIVVAPAGVTRGIEAVTRLAFLGVRLGEE
jgi:quercetin dioxygenase-like cupin family protein